MPSSRLKNWNTMPMCRRRMRASSSSLRPGDASPAIVISPSSATSRPATRLSSVDLPQPDGPMIATNSPARDVEVDAAQRAHRRELGLERLAHARAPCSTSPITLRSRSSCRVDQPVRATPASPAPSPAARSSGSSAGRGRRARPRSAPLSTSSRPGAARSCSRCARFTVSPTSVYSSRSSEPSSAAATSPVDRPMPSPNSGSPSARHCLVHGVAGARASRTRPRARGRRGRPAGTARRTRPSPRRRRTASRCRPRRGSRRSSRRGAC